MCLFINIVLIRAYMYSGLMLLSSSYGWETLQIYRKECTVCCLSHWQLEICYHHEGSLSSERVDIHPWYL